jgi:hypothetical protein
MRPGPWEADEFRQGDWRVKAPDGKGGCWWICEAEDKEHAVAIACLPTLVEVARGLLQAAESCVVTPSMETVEGGAALFESVEQVRRVVALIDAGKEP